VETVVDRKPMTITFFDEHSTCRVEVRKGGELVLTYLADTGMFRVWSFERVRSPIIDLPPMTAERNGILFGITFIFSELPLM
jgi:prolipoprotein diacylglyceryltransferase